MATIPATAAELPAGANSNEAKALLGRLQESAQKTLDQQRPWHELLDRNSFSKPESITDATNRVKKNLWYFRVNYGSAILAVVVLSMLLSPMSILWLVVLGLLWVYVFMVRSEPIVISGRMLSDQEKFICLSALSILVAFGLTSVGSILISGIIVGSAVVVAHAAFRVPDDLFLDEQDTGGFLSWLAGSHVASQLPSNLARV